MSFKEFKKSLNGEGVEGELIKTVLYSLIVSLGFLFILYYFKFKTMEDFIPKYGFYLFFAALSYAVIIPALRQVRAYKYLSCMSGMMIGMTIGMIAGFLPGFFVVDFYYLSPDTHRFSRRNILDPLKISGVFVPMRKI